MSWKKYCDENYWHEAANVLPILEGDELNDLAEDIRKYGLQNPVVLLDGKVLDGRNRLLACKLADVEPSFQEWILRAGGVSPLVWVISQNLKRRHLNASQKAMVALDILPLFEKEAKARQRQHGDTAPGRLKNTSGKNAGTVLGEARQQAAKATGAGNHYISDAKRIAERAPEMLPDIRSGVLSIPEALLKAGFQQSVEVMTSSESDNWYTPKAYIAAAKKVLGEIDLDPASCKEANKVVRAKKFFDSDDDGLSRPWKGKVWLNPPYGKKGPQFVSKLITEYKDENVEEALLLVNSHCTDAKWFKPLFDYVLCFTGHRTQFWTPEKDSIGGSTHGSVIVYFGRRRDKFVKYFEPFGAVLSKLKSVITVSEASRVA